MLAGCSLQPKAKQNVAKLVPSICASQADNPNGEFHLTGVYLTQGERATLFVHTPKAQRLAVAQLSSENPSAKILLQLDLANSGAYDLEAVGGALDVVGFVDVGSLESKQSAQHATKKSTNEKDVTPAKATDSKANETKKSDAKAEKEASAVQEKRPEKKKLESNQRDAPPAAASKKEAQNEAKKKPEPVKDSQAKSSKTEDFIPSKTFTGAKSGMVFKKGAKGLGYYKDTYVPPPPCAANSLKRKAEAPAAGAPAAKKQSLPGGLKYEVLKAAPSANAAKASRGRQVQVRYDGRLASNGRRFDKGVIKFKLGAGEVIKGWDLGVDGMRVGEKRRLLIPASLGYGSRGAPPDIPPNAALAFEVELVKV